jgi:hypothetical protein
MFNQTSHAEQNNHVYVIDLGVSRNPTVSVTYEQKTSWMLHTSVLLPAAQTIDLTIGEHESTTLALANAIQQAYASGVWPEQLNEHTIRTAHLSGVEKLKNGSEKKYIESDPSFGMLLNMHERFVNAAADAIHLARADKVEEAYAVLTGQYARASRQIVWLLKNLKQRIQTPKADTGITLAA